MATAVACERAEVVVRIRLDASARVREARRRRHPLPPRGWCRRVQRTPAARMASSAGVVTDAAGAWILIQIAELLRQAEVLHLDAITTLGPHAHAGMAVDATIVLDARDTRRLAAQLEQGAELAEQLRSLAERLAGSGVAAGYGDVRDGAAADMADGILDPQRLLLAARTLDVRPGWGALALALRRIDVSAAWGPVMPADLLSRFRGADLALVVAPLTAAGLSGREAFATCAPAALARLADALEAAVGPQP